MFAREIRSLGARDGGDAGNRGDRLFHSLMERDVRAGGVAILRQDDLREQQMIRAESRIDGCQAGERSNEEPGGDNQKRRQRDLESDDRSSNGVASLDAVGDLRAQGRERRREPEEQAGDDRDRRGKPENLPVEVRRVLRDGASSCISERESREAADRREEEAFDEHLTEEASAPGPEREPHAHLPLPPCAARQHQRGDVRAREQQDQSKEHHQHGDGRGERLLLREQAAAAVAQYQCRHGIAGANRHDRAENRDELRVERRLRRAIAHTRFRAAEDDEAAGRRIREPVPAVGGGRHERRLRQRDNDRRRRRGQCATGSGEAFGIDADDRNGDIVDLDRPSNRGRRPREFAIPEGVADHRYRGAAWHVVGRTNLATDLRPDAEHLVVVARDFVQKHALRVVADRGVRRRRVEREQITEHRILCAQMFVDGVREVGRREQPQR